MRASLGIGDASEYSDSSRSYLARTSGPFFLARIPSVTEQQVLNQQGAGVAPITDVQGLVGSGSERFILQESAAG